MKLFEAPKMELVKFDVEDIITVSGGCDDDCADDEAPIMIGDCM